MNNRMKKLVTTMMGAMLVTITAIAQVTPMVLGDKHAMLRMNEKSKYILLPVQETEEIAAIAVLDGSNNMVQRMNVKLAVDRVDYFVPYELKGAKLFDIEFHGDRRQKGAVSEFTCWKEIKFSDDFDTANREHFRPVYHHTPQYGWMNDPNGMFYKDGVWHLYYQYNPYGSQWENMHWGHSVSKDLVHWEAQPLTFEPDWLGSIFSGSCITNGSDVVAFYTSAGHHQTQSMAVSKDNGLTFVKYEGNPVITSDKPDFRDPNVFWYESTKRWIMILAVGQEMQIYSSADLKDWKYESSFGQEYGNHSGVWPSISWVNLTDTSSPVSRCQRSLSGLTMVKTTMLQCRSTMHQRTVVWSWPGCRTGSMPTRFPPSSSVAPTLSPVTLACLNSARKLMSAWCLRRKCWQLVAQS